MDAAAPELAALRAKLADLEAQVDELRVALDAATGSRGRVFAPPRPQPAWDEIEPDSRVLDGSTPSGGSKRREDKSLEWAANEISVLRLFAWSDNTKRVKRIPGEEESSSSDGIRFLARVPKDASDPTKGAELRYFKLLADGGGETPDTEESTSGTVPGKSVEHYEESSGASGGPLQLRGFADANDKLAGVTGYGESASGGKVQFLTADMLVRSRQSGARPKLEYVGMANTPFWLRNGTSTHNYAQSIKLGTASDGYITIGVQAYTI